MCAPRRAALAVCLAALAAFARPAAAQAPRRVVVVAGDAPAAATRTLAASLGELLAPYGVAVVVVATPADAPADAVAAVRLETAPRGVAVVLDDHGCVAGPSRRADRLAIRVVTALRGALEAPPAAGAASATPHPPTPAATAPAPPPAPAAPAPAPAPPPTAVSVALARRAAPARRAAAPAARPASRWFVDVGAAGWWPVGVDAAPVGSLRIGARVSGDARSGVVVGLGTWVSPWRDVAVGQRTERLFQLPVHLDVGLWLRRGRFELSAGGSLGGVYTDVGRAPVNNTLAFGVGGAADVAVRVAGPVSLVLRGAVMFMARTLITDGVDGPTLGAAGPVFVAGGVGLRVTGP